MSFPSCSPFGTMYGLIARSWCHTQRPHLKRAAPGSPGIKNSCPSNVASQLPDHSSWPLCRTSPRSAPCCHKQHTCEDVASPRCARGRVCEPCSGCGLPLKASKSCILETLPKVCCVMNVSGTNSNSCEPAEKNKVTKTAPPQLTHSKPCTYRKIQCFMHAT